MFTLKEYLALEAYYKGNIGVMEMVKFYQKADPEEKIKMKKLIADKKYDEAWEFLQQVTNTALA